MPFDYEMAYRKDGRPRRRNDHPAVCWACGHPVAPGDGCLEKSQGEWAVCHVNPCPSPKPGTLYDNYPDRRKP